MEIAVVALALLCGAVLLFYRQAQRDWDSERRILINAALHPQYPLPTQREVPSDAEQRTAVVDDIGLVGTVQSNSGGEDE